MQQEQSVLRSPQGDLSRALHIGQFSFGAQVALLGSLWADCAKSSPGKPTPSTAAGTHKGSGNTAGKQKRGTGTWGRGEGKEQGGASQDMAPASSEGKDGDAALPMSLAASGPATSLPGSEATSSRPGSLTWRRRSLNRDGRQASTSDADGMAGKGRKGRMREGSLQEELRMPDKRVCFPHWPSYLSMMAFVAFWAGFFAIGIIAFRRGQPRKLTHASDMFGFTCGEVNNWNGISVDLRGRNLLHWLDPFELTNPRNRWFAKAICVKACPAAKDVCRPQDIPCLTGNQYRCPYYGLAQDGLFDTLPYDDVWGSQYFDTLLSTTQSECWATQQMIPEVFDRERAAFVHNDSTGAKRCGQFYQLTSQYPGTGPCYANWAYSSVYLNKCVPVFPPEVEAALASYKKTQPNDTRTNDPLVQPMSGWDVGYYLLDILHGWEIMTVMGLAVPLVLSISVMLLMQKHPATIIWIGVFACVLTLIADTLLSFAKAGKIGHMAVGGEFKGDIPEGANTTGRARKLWFVTGTVIGVAALAVLIMAILIRKHIKMVVDLLKVVSRVVSDNSLVLLIPVVPTLAYMGIALFWVWSTIYQFTSPEVVPVQRSSLNSVTTWWNPNSTLPIRAYELLNLTAHPSSPAVKSGQPLGAQYYADPTMACAYDPDCYLALSFTSVLQKLFTYNYFGFWLANEFITTVTGVCIVFFLSHHYFILADGSRAQPLGWWRSIGCTWLALPPLMVGTFTNAVVDWFMVLRPICSTIDKAWTRKQERKKERGKCRTWAMAPFRGLAYVSNRLMRYSDRRGYFCGALHNKTYWQGCRIAHHLAEDSEARLAGAFEHAGSVFLLCKMGVVGLSTLGALGWSMAPLYSDALRYPDTYLSNGLLPILSCILSSYFISDLWASVYEASLGVLLLAYCEDCKMHGGQPTVSNRELVECLQGAVAQSADGQRASSGHDLAVRMFNPAYEVEPGMAETLDPRSQGLEAVDRRKTGMSL